MTTPARSAVAIFVGMTVRQAREAVAAVWPCVILRLYHGTPAFYKEGLPWAEDAYTRDDEVLRHRSLPRKKPSDTVLLLGAMTERQRRDLIYSTFELEPQWEYVYQHLDRNSSSPRASQQGFQADTLDGMQHRAERARDAFRARFGFLPAPDARFEGVTLTPD